MGDSHQNDDAVCRVCEPLEREQRVVGLHDDVAHADRVRRRVVARLLHLREMFRSEPKSMVFSQSPTSRLSYC